ncbi:hypothetical protein [Halarcobacter anaerophilus]|uniref:hypothetical protein n=1 Tax=Halarcobacter anaerophilus TaxID=877500 RepID=UPI0005CAAE3F|nr:hypothetical protein [Halarcobacter anaerophilus]
MKKEDLTITDRKSIEELIQELQYLDSNIIPILKKDGEIYSNIKELNFISKQSYMKIFQVISTLEQLIEEVNKSVENIADTIDITPIQDRIIESMSLDKNTLNQRVKSLYRELSISLSEAQTGVEDIKEYKDGISELKKELKYMKIINIFLFIGMVLFLYKS